MAHPTPRGRSSLQPHHRAGSVTPRGCRLSRVSRLASLPQGHSHQAQSHVQGPPGEPTRSSAGRGLRPPDTSTPSLRPDLQAKAVELEHEMFRNAKAANLYKASVLRKVGGVGMGGACSGSGWERRPLHTPRLAATSGPGSPESTPYQAAIHLGGAHSPPLPAGATSSQAPEDWTLAGVQLPTVTGHRSPPREPGWGLPGACGCLACLPSRHPAPGRRDP